MMPFVRPMRRIIRDDEDFPFYNIAGSFYLGGKNCIDMSKESLATQHQNHKTWLNYLAFYKDEMLILQKRLEEVVAKHMEPEVLASIEHFQNQLILQKEQHDILRHDIKQYENRIEALYGSNPVFADNARVEEEAELIDRVDTFARLFREMKDELYRFVSRNL